MITNEIFGFYIAHKTLWLPILLRMKRNILSYPTLAGISTMRLRTETARAVVTINGSS